MKGQQEGKGGLSGNNEGLPRILSARRIWWRLVGQLLTGAPDATPNARILPEDREYEE